MSKRIRAMQATRTLAVLVLALLFVSAANTYFNLRLFSGASVGWPTNPSYPNTGFTNVLWNVAGGCSGTCSAGGGSVNSAYLNMANCIDPFNGANVCGLYGTPAGNLNIPLGLIGTDYEEKQGCLGGTCVTDFYWYTLDPPNIPSSCSGVPKLQNGQCYDVNGISLVGTTAGTPILLTQASPTGDPTCTTPSGSTQAAGNGCWSADYSTISSYQAGHPGCNYSAVTACLLWNQAGNLTVAQALSTVTAWCNTSTCNANNVTQVKAAIGPNYSCGSGCTSSSDVVQTTQQSWYLYRMITDIQLQIVPPTITVQCSAGATSCVTSGGCILYCPSNADLQGWVQNTVLPEVNKMNLLTGAQINFGISISGFVPVFSSNCGTNNNCFWGITNVWVGGQGVQYTGCPNTSFCTMVQGQHTQLGLYTNPGLTAPASVPTSADVLDMSRLTNSSFSQTVQKSVSQFSQVYTSVTTQSIGTQYSYNSNCNYTNLGQCINAPSSNLYVNVPLLFDIIGSFTNYYYQYPGVPPPGGSPGGAVSGHVYGVGSGALGLTNGPLAGACVGLNGQCSGYPGQFQATTGGDGSYVLGSGNQIPPGTYSISVSATGYVSQTVTGIKVTTGQSVTVDFTLNTVSPAGQSCLVPPAYSPIPPYGQVFGGVCVPNWVVPAVLILTGLGLVAIIFVSPGGSALGFGAASLIGRVRRR